MNKYPDSMDKIFKYFRCVTKEPLIYKGEVFQPLKHLILLDSLFYGFKCVPGCTVCCLKFTLDYIPPEPVWPLFRLSERQITINGITKPVWSYFQEWNRSDYCTFQTEWGCTQYPYRAFTCDFELLRFSILNDEIATLGVELYKNPFLNLKRGGPRCYLLPETKRSKKEVVRKLKRLKTWCEYFKIDNRVDDIIKGG